MYRSVILACLLALTLAGCNDLYGEDVVKQAAPNGNVAFDVVKIDDAVVTTLAARQPPPFKSRFKEYVPPPELQIAVGDTVSVIIWEAAANGLYGNSLTELSFPGGGAARALTQSESSSALRGVPSAPGGLTVSPDLLMLLYAGQGAAGGNGLGGARDTALGDNSTAGSNPLQGALSQGQGQGEANRSGFGGSASSQGVSPEKRRLRQTEQLLDVATQSGRPGTRIPDQQVGADGSISIPYAGRFQAAGHTPTELQKSVAAALAGKALEPQVLVVVKRSPANSVSVAGEIINGARVPLTPGGERLLQIIAEVGGARAPAHDTFVRLTRNGVTASIPLATLVSDPAQDIYAEPGDVLTLVRRPQTFSVFGATGKNTALQFGGAKLSLAEALARAGGLDDRQADPRSVFLFRYEPVQIVKALGQPIATDAPPGVSPIAYRLDLMEAKSYGLAQRFPVHDKDIIFVANSRYVEIYKYFQALSQVAGPVVTGLVTCQAANC